MSTPKLRMILKAFTESQFSYCPLVWMVHSRTLNNRINSLYERALRLVYKDPKFSFEELLQMAIPLLSIIETYENRNVQNHK